MSGYLKAGLQLGLLLEQFVEFDFVRVSLLCVSPVNLLVINDGLLLGDFGINGLHRAVQVVDVDLILLNLTLEVRSPILGFAGFVQLSLALFRVIGSLNGISGVQGGSLRHNHIGLDLRRTCQDGGSLKLSASDELHLSTGGHIQVADDASTANVPGRVSTRVSKESQHIGSLGRVFDFLSNSNNIAKNDTGVDWVSTLGGDLVQAVHRTESTGETDAHTSASAVSVTIVKASKQSTSTASDKAVFPYDTGSVHHPIFDASTLQTAKQLSVIGKHSCLGKSGFLSGSTHNTRHHRYALKKFTGFLFHIDGAA